MIQEKLTPNMLVAASKHFVNNVSNDLIEQFTNDFEKHLAEADVKKKEPQNFFTVFNVDAYRDTDYEMELWVQVESTGQNTENIQFKTVPEHNVASILVSEHYDNLQFAYDALFDYVNKHDYIVDGYPRETYIPDDSAPLGYLTEIQLPFKMI